MNSLIIVKESIKLGHPEFILSPCREDIFCNTLVESVPLSFFQVSQLACGHPVMFIVSRLLLSWDNNGKTTYFQTIILFLKKLPAHSDNS